MRAPVAKPGCDEIASLVGIAKEIIAPKIDHPFVDG
jgi:hypothetical protein